MQQRVKEICWKLDDWGVVSCQLSVLSCQSPVPKFQRPLINANTPASKRRQFLTSSFQLLKNVRLYCNCLL